MGKIRIYTDTCSDLGRDLREKYDISYAKMCTVNDGAESPADLDFPDYTPKEFYDILRGGKRILTTQVPMEEFRRCFTASLAAGEEILYIGCALPMSSSVNTAGVVARELSEQYPNAVIRCVDSTCSCLGEGMLAVYAAELRDQGKSIDEIAAAVEEKKHTVNQFCTVGSLDMLKKAGRVKGSAAFFGNLLGVKPIIISDRNGQNVPVCKVKGRRASLDKLVEMMKEAVIDPASQTVYIAHADCLADAEYVRDAMLREVGFRDAYLNFIGPIIGASIGPGAIAVYGYGKTVEMAV